MKGPALGAPCLRVQALLATIAPLTPGQISRALNDLTLNDVNNAVFSLRRSGVVRTVSQSARQRQVSGHGSAYALAAR